MCVYIYIYIYIYNIINSKLIYVFKNESVVNFFAQWHINPLGHLSKGVQTSVARLPSRLDQCP